jgi:CheY-like chemotaxis protein
MEPLLARSLPERIRLVIALAPPGLWPCVADRNQLEAALLNLVLNARDAIPAEGTVTIRCENQTILGPAESEEDRPGSGDYVCISVRDNGTGMPEEVRRRAFEPFFTTKPPGEGSGLGLAQIYGFVRQSGGTVRIESAPGTGTRIEMLLPRASEAVPEPEGVPAAEIRRERAGKGERILLAEDEANVRELAADALRELGYHVLEASDVPDALRIAAKEEDIDLLFTDVMLPGSRTGVDLALELRRERPDLPVLFATGYSDRAVLSRWPGKIRLLAKPYAPAVMAQQVRACLDEAGVTVQAHRKTGEPVESR